MYFLATGSLFSLGITEMSKLGVVSKRIKTYGANLASPWELQLQQIIYIRQNTQWRNRVENFTHLEEGWLGALGLSCRDFRGDDCPPPPCWGVGSGSVFFFDEAGGVLRVGLLVENRAVSVSRHQS